MWDVCLSKTCSHLPSSSSGLVTAFKEAREEWAGRRPDKPNHLPEQGQQPDDVCPSQIGLPMQCPCKSGSHSQGVCAPYLTDTPAMIFLPSYMASSWVEEVHEVFAPQPDKEEPFLTSLKTAGNLTAQRQEKEWDNLIRATKGMKVNDHHPDIQDPTGTLMGGGEGLATDIFMVSNSTMQKLLTKFRKEPGLRAYRLTVDAVFMDEHHNYTGANKRAATIPFK